MLHIGHSGEADRKTSADTIAKLQTTLAATQQRATDAETRLGALESDSQKAAADAEARINALEAAKRKLTAEVADLKAAADAAAAAAAANTPTRSGADEASSFQLKQTKAALAKAQEQIEELEKQLDETTKRANTADDRLKKSWTKITALEERVQQAESAVRSPPTFRLVSSRSWSSPNHHRNQTTTGQNGRDSHHDCGSARRECREGLEGCPCRCYRGQHQGARGRDQGTHGTTSCP